MPYTAERIRKLDPAAIAQCSPAHIESVIKDLSDTALDREAKFESLHHHINHLRSLIYPPKMSDSAAWRKVPMKHAADLMALIDPPPVEVEGKTMVFVNPYAAEALTAISTTVRAMFAAVPPAPDTAQKWTDEEIASMTAVHKGALVINKIEGPKMKAPWPDYAGNEIYEGDMIRHPGVDGETAIVTLDEKRDEFGRWRAVYPDGMSLFLGNQVSKGMAVVVKPLAHSAGIDTQEVAAEKNAAARRLMDNVAAQSAVAAASDWKDRLYAELDAEFELRGSDKRDADGQRMGLRDDDTQIGAEFAMRWFEQNMLAAAPLHEAGNAAAPEPFAFVIIDKDSNPEFVTSDRNSAQEHINDACMQGDIEGAGKWKAVPVFKMRPTDDHLWDQTIRDRDAYHDWADKLAEAIAKHFNADIGEHSNMNLPWSEALDAIESAAPSIAAPTEVDRDAKFWRTFERALRTRHIPGAAHGRRFKIIEVCAISGDESEFNDFIGAVEALATKE